MENDSVPKYSLTPRDTSHWFRENLPAIGIVAIVVIGFLLTIRLGH